MRAPRRGLQITAGLLASHPDQPLAERAERLTSAGRLEGIDDGERSLRATFDQSFESLPPLQAELFRLLSLSPGPDISTTAAALLTEQSQVATEKLLGHLATAHLIERGTVRGRWQMHDLLHEYAHKQATAQCERSRPSRRRYDQARTRLTGHYVRTAEAADTHLEAGRAAVAPLFTDREQALAWLDAERENLIATAHSEGTTQTALRLGFSLGSYLEHRRRLQDLLTIRSLALDACTARGNTLNEVNAWNNLGTALREVRRFDNAIDAGERATTMLVAEADWFRTGKAWEELATTLEAAGAAPTHIKEAWERSAAYTRAGATEAAESSRGHVDGPRRSGPPRTEHVAEAAGVFLAGGPNRCGAVRCGSRCAGRPVPHTDRNTSAHSLIALGSSVRSVRGPGRLRRRRSSARPGRR
ncbi:hypothetical protein R6M67_34540 [Streptomyces sp. Wh19]|nr:hypothetical protein [Streptomyces sp. Wh19]MDV9200309.1 hypothetical protein [Streptomyces sp. Wh19]